MCESLNREAKGVAGRDDDDGDENEELQPTNVPAYGRRLLGSLHNVCVYGIEYRVCVWEDVWGVEGNSFRHRHGCTL